MYATNCEFFAKFGLRYRSSKIVIKKHNLNHTGVYTEGRGKDGRAPKTARQGIIDDSIESVLKIKASDPVPSDIMKSSHVVQGIGTSYNQAYHRALNLESLSRQIKNEESYQLIIPYLQEFHNKNPVSGRL